MPKISRHGGATNNPTNVHVPSVVYSYPVGLIPAGPVRPAETALKAMWVDYALAQGLIFPHNVTKAQLITMVDRHDT